MPGGGTSKSSPGDSGAEAVRKHWRLLFQTLACLWGDSRLDSLLSEKHSELKELLKVAGGPRPMPLEAEGVQLWFSRKLKSKSSCQDTMVALCKKLTHKVKHLGTDWRHAEPSRIDEALRERHIDEGPLVCCALSKELEGSRFEGMWISRESPGVYRLGEEGLRVAVQILDGKLLVHGYFEGDLLHPVRVAILPFLQEHGPSRLLCAADADCDLFGGRPKPVTGRDARSRSPIRNKAMEESSPLPPGWIRKESRSKPGVHYYANEAKGLTQFDRPAASSGS